MLPLNSLIENISSNILQSKDLALDVRSDHVVIHELIKGEIKVSVREDWHQEGGLFGLFQKLNDRYRGQTPVVSLLVPQQELGYFKLDPLPAGLKKKDRPFYVKAQYKRLGHGELGDFDLINQSDRVHLITYSSAQSDMRAQLIRAGFPFVHFYPLPLFHVDQFREVEFSDAAFLMGALGQSCLVIKTGGITSLYFQNSEMPQAKLRRAYREASLLNPDLTLFVWDDSTRNFSLLSSEVLDNAV